MASEWMYAQEGKQYGPVSSSQLKALAESGKLKPTDLVWKDGMAQWAAASKLQNLFTPTTPLVAPSAAPPVPTIAPPPMQKIGALHEQPTSPTNAWKSVISRRMSQVVLIEHSEGLGTGLLIGKDGLIVTNKHVVEGSNFVNVCFWNNTTTKGVVLHHHPSVDLAVVKAAVHNAEYLNVKDDAAGLVEAGDEVIAIGHPHGLRFTSTRGIVSSPRRRCGQDFFIQHDVAINPGNSGGPLIDDQGKLVGINTFLRKDSQGLGFAIPSPVVQVYLDSILQALSEGKLVVPSDEEILESDVEITPEEALNTALESYEGERQELEDGGQLFTSPEGHTLAVWIQGEVVLCLSHVADLNKASLRDADLLRQLLELN